MRLTFIISLMLLTLAASGQKLVKLKKDLGDGAKEVYYVLKSDKSLKHGLYERMGSNKRLLESGTYAQGEKVGIWRTYHKYSKAVAIEVEYVDGKKHGFYKEYEGYGNGKPTTEGAYVNGMRSGSWKILARERGKILTEVGEFVKGQRQGSWKSYYFGTEILAEECNYLNDKLNGSWKGYFYNEKKGVLSSEGKYLAGVRKGEWKFYNSKSELIQHYDYSENKLLDFKPTEKKQYFVIHTDSGRVEKILERPPMFIGGEASLNATTSQNVHYPQLAREAGVQGTVLIRFVIEKDGRASKHEVVEGLPAGCNEAALEAVKSIPDNWIPAIYQGKLVRAEIEFPINFILR